MEANKNILVIDDDAALAAQVVLGARALGFSAVSTQDPGSIDSRSLANIDVIALDLLMPSLDGIEFLRSLAKRNATAPPPAIILMSGLDRRTLESARQMAQRSGLEVLGVLKKPFGLNELRDVLIRYSPHHRQAATARNAKIDVGHFTASDVLAAVFRGEIVPYFQPQVSLVDGSWTGLEALARWEHPVQGLLLPGAFICHADSEDIAVPFAQAFADIAISGLINISRNTGFRGSLSINVSPTALGHYALAEHILASIESRQINGSSLILEITETALASREAVALDIQTRLRMRGVRTSIDDFGTGQSGLERLRGMPCDELKIDRVFVSDADTNPTSRSIAENAIRLGHSLGMTVVAEGVENSWTFQWLRSAGCDIAQGYWVAPPMSSTNLAAWAKTWSGRLTTNDVEPPALEAVGG